MRVEHVKDDYGMLLATIVRQWPSGGSGLAYEFFTDPAECLQLGRFLRPKGYEVKPHCHAPEHRKVQATAEVLFILSGRVVLYVGRDWACDNPVNYHADLKAGDVAIVLRGYHSLTVLEDAEIWEVKNGPYQADEKKFSQPIKEIEP